MRNDEDQQGWKRALEGIDRGETDGIVMHVDTLRLFVDSEWDELKELGLKVAVFQRIRDEA